ncbi:phage tail protein [bacterium]|jgi:phage tail-like protein|nr:phage tail protein [bacterium]
MAILGIDDFKSKLTGGGARPNLFKATVNFPSYAQGNVELTSFLCKAVAIPSSVIAPIELNFRGRKMSVAGDRTFEPVTLTVINDAAFEVRNSFERWMNGINQHNANTGLSNPTEYQSDVVIEQLNKAGDTVKTYNVRGCYPTNLSAIDLNYDSENAIEEFTVEMQVTYWESDTTS